MRRVVDILMVLMLAGVLAGVGWYYRQKWDRQQRIIQVQQALAQIQEQVLYQKAIGAGGGLFPRTIQPEWFGGTLPKNVLLPPEQPWIDVAPENDWTDQPPDPVIRSPRQAGFWYNPQRGLVRARVPEELSRQQTLTLYNLINGTHLSELPEANDPQRQPIAVEKLAEVSENHLEGIPEPVPAPSLRSDRGRQNLRR